MVIQELLEPTAVGAGFHSISTNFRIILLNWLFAASDPNTSVTEDKSKKNYLTDIGFCGTTVITHRTPDTRTGRVG